MSRPTELVNFPIQDQDDAALIVHAACRGRVLLADGHVVTLIRWKGTRVRNGRSEDLGTARCAQVGGSPFTIACAQVLALCVEADAE